MTLALTRVLNSWRWSKKHLKLTTRWSRWKAMQLYDSWSNKWFIIWRGSYLLWQNASEHHLQTNFTSQILNEIENDNMAKHIKWQLQVRYTAFHSTNSMDRLQLEHFTGEDPRSLAHPRMQSFVFGSRDHHDHGFAQKLICLLDSLMSVFSAMLVFMMVQWIWLFWRILMTWNYCSTVHVLLLVIYSCKYN